MKNLKNIIVSFTVLVLLNSCVLRPTTPRFEEIPKGISCIILSKKGFCIDSSNNNSESNKSFRQMRGFEAVPMGYKEELESFLYDILKENEILRIQCGDNE